MVRSTHALRWGKSSRSHWSTSSEAIKKGFATRLHVGRVAELADSEDLYEMPLRPYTQALLSAMPVTDPEVESERKRIILEGDVPSPVNPPSGCNFHPRCWKAQQICREVIPPLE